MRFSANIQNNNTKKSNQYTRVTWVSPNAFLIQHRVFLSSHIVSKNGLSPNKRMHMAGANVMEDPFDDHCHYHHHNIHRHAGCACLECALERELSKSIN